MKKVELRKLKTLTATQEMMAKAKANEQAGTHMRYGREHKYKYMYATFLRCQTLSYGNGRIIKAAVFLPKYMQEGIITPKYEVFLNIEGEEYITRELDKYGKEVAWKTAMIKNLPEYNYWEINECKELAYMNPEGARTIERFLHVNKGGFDGIADFEQRCRDKKTLECERRETAPWDEDMKLVPKYPRSFKKWMGKEVSDDDYIFYKYQRTGAKEGYCTHCQKMVSLKDTPKHRNEGICPVCKRPIIYIATGKKKVIWTRFDYGNIVQKVKGGFVVREFDVRWSYVTDDVKKSKLMLHESARTFCRNGKLDRYEYGMYKNKYYRWIKEKNHFIGRYYGGKERTYAGNICAIENEISKRSAMDVFIRNNCDISPIRYLIYEQANPAVEKLMKIGMVKMAIELSETYFGIDIANQETELTKILLIDKARLNRLKAMDAGVCELEWMRLEKENNTKYSDELITWYSKNVIRPKDLKFIANRMSYEKIKNYIMRQQEKTGEATEQVLRTWDDYLNMAENLKMQMNVEQIYRPKDLAQAHAEMIELREAGSIKKQSEALLKRFPKVNEVCKTLGKYEWADEEFAVVVPKNMEDIVREGTVLRHCIHTCDYYVDRISKRESYLLFLRKTASPETPWYTLEVEPGGNIRQKRTTGDNQNEDFKMAVIFLKKWQQVIQKRIDEEDRKLAKESEKARKENYQNLKKNGNRIWHGKLQGKLLADVLEQDFMAVI